MTGRDVEGEDPSDSTDAPHLGTTDLLESLILDVPDFPRPGVVFKDITPLIGSAEGLAAAIEGLVAAAPPEVDLVLGMEARGFIFGAPVAYGISVGFVPVRKPGKLPRDTFSVTYDLEYGTDTIAVHADAIPPGARVLIVDDVLATGARWPRAVTWSGASMPRWSGCSWSLSSPSSTPGPGSPPTACTR